MMQLAKRIIAKESTKYILLIVGFGILASLPLLMRAVPFGHDIVPHFFRYMGTLNALQDGQLLPQVDPAMLGGYGYSWNIFYGPLPCYLVTILYMITGTWSLAINIFTVACIIFSGIGMYFLVMQITKNPGASFIAACVYMFAPYHLTDYFIRQAQGEFIPLVAAPFLFMGLYGLINHCRSYKYSIAIISTSAATIVLSHNISTMLFAIASVLYLLMNFKKLRSLRVILSIAACGLLTLCLSAIYVFPFLEARFSADYGIFSSDLPMATNADFMNANALSFARLVYDPPITNGSSEVMPFSLGVFVLLAVPMFIFARKNMDPNVRLFCTQSIIIGLAFLIFTTVLIPWHFMPKVLYFMQFPWRLLMVSTLMLSVVSGMSLYALIKNHIDRNKFLASFAIGFLALLCSCPYLAYGMTCQKINEQQVLDTYSYSVDDDMTQRRLEVDQYAPISLGKDAPANSRLCEAMTKNVSSRTDMPLLIGGTGVITEWEKNGTKSSFTVSKAKDAILELPYVYYPGYIVEAKTCEGAMKLIGAESSNGFLQVSAPQGNNIVIETYYGLSAGSTIGLCLTALALTVLIVAFVIHFIKIRCNIYNKNVLLNKRS